MESFVITLVKEEKAKLRPLINNLVRQYALRQQIPFKAAWRELYRRYLLQGGVQGRIEYLESIDELGPLLRVAKNL